MAADAKAPPDEEMHADPTADFHGAKIAILIGPAGDRLLAILRDDCADIPHPGLWDLPGGGREGQERPEETARRELREELGLALDAARIEAARAYLRGSGRRSWFLLARWPDLDLAAVRFGNEGQRWAAMPVTDFLSRHDAIPALQARLARALAAAKRSRD